MAGLWDDRLLMTSVDAVLGVLPPLGVFRFLLLLLSTAGEGLLLLDLDRSLAWDSCLALNNSLAKLARC